MFALLGYLFGYHIHFSYAFQNPILFLVPIKGFRCTVVMHNLSVDKDNTRNYCKCLPHYNYIYVGNDFNACSSIVCGIYM